MLTVFTIPKPFKGRAAVAQRNSIESWKRIAPGVEVIVFGDEEGARDVCAELGVKHVAELSVNEFGTPLVGAAFDAARRIARNDILVYSNADIILTADLAVAVGKIGLSEYLVLGRRWDVDAEDLINFDDPVWENRLRGLIKEKGGLHGYSGIDYFVFPRSLDIDLPGFAVGRPGWDNWLIYDAKRRGVPIIDATLSVTAIHQNHESVYKNKKNEVKKNFKLGGGFARRMTIRNADLVLATEGIRKPALPMRISSAVLSHPFVLLLLSVKRNIQNRFAFGGGGGNIRDARKS